MAVTLSDLQMAVDFGSDIYSDSEAYLDTESGEIIYAGDLVDTDIPSDLYENSKYLLLPTKQELDLGKSLVLAFARKHLPTHFDVVEEIFRRKGAYSRFKELLQSLSKVEDWYAFENKKSIETIRHWCNENGVEFEDET